MHTTITQRLKALANPEKARILARFFKTGPGEYGEGDRFLGITVPQIRAVAKAHRDLSLAQAEALLASPWHEERLLALVILVEQFRRGDEALREAIYRFYLAHTARINNWDLVDLSAKQIVGGMLADRDRSPLYRLAESTSLWERRIALLATFHFIGRGEFADSLALCEQLRTDREPLIHKALGWMLREIGKRDLKVLRDFLARHAAGLPRTTLRYAIERLPPAERRRWLAIKGEAA